MRIRIWSFEAKIETNLILRPHFSTNVVIQQWDPIFVFVTAIVTAIKVNFINNSSIPSRKLCVRKATQDSIDLVPFHDSHANMIVFFAQVYANKTIKYVLYSLPLECNVSVNGNKQAIQAYIIV